MNNIKLSNTLFVFSGFGRKQAIKPLSQVKNRPLFVYPFQEVTRFFIPEAILILLKSITKGMQFLTHCHGLQGWC